MDLRALGVVRAQKRCHARRLVTISCALSHACFEALNARFDGTVDFFVLTQAMAQRQFVMADAPSHLNVQTFARHCVAASPVDDVHWNDPRPVLNGYDLIVLRGWDEPTFLTLWLLARLQKTRIAFGRSRKRRAARHVEGRVQTLFAARGGGTIAMGTNAAAYCEWLGVARENIFIAPNAETAPIFRHEAR